VALGRFGIEALDAMAMHLRQMFEHCGARLHGVRWCPHAPADGCECRKPRPGMLEAAAAAFGIDLARSWMVGDILDDVEAGHRAGCRSILIDNGNETLWRPGPGREPEHRVADLRLAARLIIDDAGQREAA
jgi:histidinol-phosphate phosphatase family protein